MSILIHGNYSYQNVLPNLYTVYSACMVTPIRLNSFIKPQAYSDVSVQLSEFNGSKNLVALVTDNVM